MLHRTGAETPSSFIGTDHMTALMPLAVKKPPSLEHTACYWVVTKGLQSSLVFKHFRSSEIVPFEESNDVGRPD